MKNIFALLVVSVSLLMIPAGNTKLAPAKELSRFASDHFIVKLKKSENIFAASNPYRSNYELKITQICSEIGITPVKIKQLYPASKQNTQLYSKYELETFYIVFINEARDIKDLCSEFSKKSKVDYSEPDFTGSAAGFKGTGTETVAPNDEFFSKQWGLSNNGSLKTTTGKNGVRGADMNVLKGWDIETGSQDIVVGILDSGAKIDHPDLYERIWVNKSETKNGRDDDGNGFIDDINGYNFAYDNPSVRDDGGHGTNISGTVGASTNNALGFAGIDQKCRLMICKNLDDENLGEYSWWSASLYYAANNGARVINMSEGGYDYSKTLETAINFAYEAGCLIVASMMNKNNSDSYYPASFKNVMAIGATDTDDSRCREFTWGGGSNWGKHISVVAPGNKVYGLDYKDNFNYDVYWSGTSQATAYVTGIASLLLGQDPSRTNKDLKEIITKSAVDKVGDPREDTNGWDQFYGWGRVDLFEALNYGNSSGKTEKVRDRDYEDVTPPVEDNTNDTRAKAKDPTDNDRDYDRPKDDDRAKKPKAKDR